MINGLHYNSAPAPGTWLGLHSPNEIHIFLFQYSILAVSTLALLILISPINHVSDNYLAIMQMQWNSCLCGRDSAEARCCALARVLPLSIGDCVSMLMWCHGWPHNGLMTGSWCHDTHEHQSEANRLWPMRGRDPVMKGWARWSGHTLHTITLCLLRLGPHDPDTDQASTREYLLGPRFLRRRHLRPLLRPSISQA